MTLAPPGADSSMRQNMEFKLMKTYETDSSLLPRLYEIALPVT